MTRSARHARRSRIFILIVSIFLLIMAAAYLAVGVYYKDRFFPGSYINGEDCSGMTVDEVEKRIADSVTDYQITITERGGAEEVIDGSAIDFPMYPQARCRSFRRRRIPSTGCTPFSIRRITPWWWKLPTTRAF